MQLWLTVMRSAKTNIKEAIR